MKKLLEYLPLHFLLCLIVGISLQYHYAIWNFSKIAFVFVFVILAISLYLLKQSKFFIALVNLTFLCIGVFLVYQGDFRNKPNYFRNFTQENQTAVLEITKILKPTNYYNKFEANVVQIGDYKTTGKVLVNLKKNKDSLALQVDDKVLTSADFVSVKKPLNPHQFNYKNYLAKEGIHHQLYLQPTLFFVMHQKPNSILGLANNFRQNVQAKLKEYHFSNDELGVISALLLGQRQDISEELLDDYSNAGAIHILAVSGLHVGIIMLMISFFCKPLERFKNGKKLKLFIVVLSLWLFATIAGLSASVVRAVTMFTAVSFGLFLNRKNSVEHSLIMSMLLLLLVKPMFLFDVGFQLSYLAVFGIIWIQPKLNILYKPNNILMKKVWQLLTVSIAAQCGILPLSLFYFHQFPGLFLLTNLVIVPFLGMILTIGIVVIVLSQCSILPQIVADSYGFIISKMNSFIAFVSGQEQFLFHNISFSLLNTLSLYLLIISFFIFFSKRSAKRFLMFLVTIVLFQSVILFEKHKLQRKKEFIVFHQSRESVMAIREGEKLYINKSKSANNYAIKNYLIGENIRIDTTRKFDNYYQLDSVQILIVDSLGAYKIDYLSNPIIVLSNSPKINLNRLIKRLNPSRIIADGSNYKSRVLLWKEVCAKTKTPFWYTGQNGAYQLSF